MALNSLYVTYVVSWPQASSGPRSFFIALQLVTGERSGSRVSLWDKVCKSQVTGQGQGHFLGHSLLVTGKRLGPRSFSSSLSTGHRCEVGPRVSLWDKVCKSQVTGQSKGHFLRQSLLVSHERSGP
jgi:hypothetical protein